MTFRQILGVLWQRKWLIVAVVALAVIIATVYIQVQPKSFESTATAQTSADITTAASGGQLGGVQVDVDPSAITSPTVLAVAAKLAGRPGADLTSQVSYTVTNGDKTNVFDIAADASSPAAARKLVESVIEAYKRYLADQTNIALGVLEKRQATATAQAQLYQAQSNNDPSDSIAASNLNNALSQLSSLTDQITAINNSGSPFTTLTPASVGQPLGTSPWVVLLIALAGGLIAGMGVALIRDQFDDRVRGEHEIESLTSLPSLGELTLDRALARRNESLPVAGREQTSLSEGLRSLRTAMQVLLPRENAVVVFTSVEPGDGKTFVSANVALTWARAGKNVILVGGDLRRPTLDAYFGQAADGPGLTELLQDAPVDGGRFTASQIESKLRSTEFRGLRILPSGLESADPADLLATSALGRLVTALRPLADVIIFDSPPAMALVDASLLAEHSDGVIVLCSVNRTDRSFLVEAVDMLRQNGAKVLGVVANRSRRTLPRSYAPYYTQAKTTPLGDSTEWEGAGSTPVAVDQTESVGPTNTATVDADR